MLNFIEDSHAFNYLRRRKLDTKCDCAAVFEARRAFLRKLEGGRFVFEGQEGGLLFVRFLFHLTKNRVMHICF